jgi:hypothetical protein
MSKKDLSGSVLRWKGLLTNVVPPCKIIFTALRTKATTRPSYDVVSLQQLYNN